MLTQDQLDFLKTAADAAVQCERKTGVPAEVSVAQCVLESGWGKRMPGNNCFGIKDSDKLPGCQYCVTKEYLNGTWNTLNLAFEVYPTLADCFTEHAELLKRGVYAPHWEQYQQDHDLDGFIVGIAKHYATDPMYATQVKALAHGPHITAEVQTAREKAMEDAA